LLDRQGGIHAEMEPQLGMMTVLQLPNNDAQRAGRRWDPSTNCTVQIDGQNRTSQPVGTETVIGYSTYKIIDDSPKARRTVWRAPSLGCADLHSLFEFKGSDGSVTDTSELSATSVSLGEPIATVWAIPQNLENVSFSARYQQFMAKRGSPVVATVLASLQQQDTLFQQFRYNGQ
jgi:hypothetical protein